MTVLCIVDMKEVPVLLRTILHLHKFDKQHNPLITERNWCTGVQLPKKKLQGVLGFRR